MCSTDTVTQSVCDVGGVAENPLYEPNGYVWAVDVPAADVGTPITVSIYDPAISNTGSPLFENTASPTSDFHTSYELFNTTGDVNHTSTDPALSMGGRCQSGPGRQVFGFGTNAGAPDYFEHWFELCTFVPTQAGIFPLQVKTSNIPGIADAGTGWNVYSVKAVSTSPTQPQVFALDHLSIYTAQPGASANYYLANIPASWHGHTMTVDLFDPGDGAGPSAFTMQFLAPPSGLGIVPTGGTSVGCNYNATPSSAFGPATPDTSANCTVVTKQAGSNMGLYNGRWLLVSIVIPTSYSCTTDCWWSIHSDLGTSGSTPSDRMTISVNVSANVAS